MKTFWVCPKCGEKIEDQFDSCWKCAGQPEHPSPPGYAARRLVRFFLLGILFEVVLIALGFLLPESWLQVEVCNFLVITHFPLMFLMVGLRLESAISGFIFVDRTGFDGGGLGGVDLSGCAITQSGADSFLTASEIGFQIWPRNFLRGNVVLGSRFYPSSNADSVYSFARNQINGGRQYCFRTRSLPKIERAAGKSVLLALQHFHFVGDDLCRRTRTNRDRNGQHPALQSWPDQSSGRVRRIDSADESGSTLEPHYAQDSQFALVPTRFSIHQRIFEFGSQILPCGGTPS